MIIQEYRIRRPAFDAAVALLLAKPLSRSVIIYRPILVNDTTKRSTLSQLLSQIAAVKIGAQVIRVLTCTSHFETFLHLSLPVCVSDSLLFALDG